MSAAPVKSRPSHLAFLGTLVAALACSTTEFFKERALESETRRLRAQIGGGNHGGKHKGRCKGAFGKCRNRPAGY